MGSIMRRIKLLAKIAGVLCCTLGYARAALAAESLPELLKGQTFIYDELETGEGTALYTLIFTEDGYRLYNDGGVGIISEGTVTVSDGRSLVFEDGRKWADNASPGTFYGSYTGSAFQSPSVTLEYDGRTIELEPDSESGEYVYLSYLGVFEGKIENEPAMLILDRWYEFYLYTDNTLVRGTYEIYADGTAEFSTLEYGTFSGTVDKVRTDSFDVRETAFSIDFSLSEGNGTEAVFACAEPFAEYAAEHAMGTYTLSLYDEEVFVIRGVDGYVKAMGTIDIGEEGGTVSYFPRAITNDVELDDKFNIAFTCEADSLVFPSSTYLLPRSGNIDETTGYGSYWSAGTTLEFIQNTGSESANRITYEAQDTSKKTAPISCVYENSEGQLQSDMPSLGTAKPLVLLVDFPDYKRPRFVTAEGIREALFELDNDDSLSAYYYRSSYGNLTIDGTVLDWYRMEKERDAYASDKEIITEALDYYINEEGLDLTAYDADRDGCVDSVYVLWAGTLDMASNTWSAAYRSRWADSPKEWAAKVTGYIFVPGTTVWSSVPPLVCNINSLTHETGHLLGLNDYYSYDTSGKKRFGSAYTGGALEGGIGGMDMMDANIGDHNAFSKWLLGWLEPEVIEFEETASLEEEGKIYTLSPSNEQGNAIFVKLQASDSLFTELLVIEAVSPTMNAGELTRLKEPVVRILHVDASPDEEALEGNWNAFGFKYDNSYTTTKFISILEADGKDEILNYVPAVSGTRMSYDTADYYTAGSTVTPNTYPNTNGYDKYGNATVYNGLTITVESISESGETVIRIGYEAQADVLSVEAVAPEPVIVPCRTDELVKVPSGTDEIVVSFDREIAEADEGSLEKILVVSGNELLEDYRAETDGARLKVVFEEPLEENCDYTVVIPAGILKSAESETVINNFNSIFGFVTEN